MTIRRNRVLLIAAALALVITSLTIAHSSPVGSYHTSHIHYTPFNSYWLKEWTGWCYQHDWYYKDDYTHHYDPSGTLQQHGPDYARMGTYDDVYRITCPG